MVWNSLLAYMSNVMTALGIGAVNEHVFSKIHDVMFIQLFSFREYAINAE